MLGLDVSRGASNYPCPRNCSFTSSLFIDTESERFFCQGCGLKGQGLSGLARWGELFRIRFTFAEDQIIRDKFAFCNKGVNRFCFKGSRLKFSYLPCGCKSCDACHSDWLRHRIGHYGRLLMPLTIDRISLPASTRWESVSRRLRRQSANYLRLPLRTEETIVYTTARVATTCLPEHRSFRFEAHSRQSNEEGIVTSLWWDFNNADIESNISASRAWSMTSGTRRRAEEEDDTSREQTGEIENGWKLLQCPGNPRESIEAAIRLGHISADIHQAMLPRSIEWSGPEALTTEWWLNLLQLKLGVPQELERPQPKGESGNGPLEPLFCRPKALPISDCS